MRRRFTPYDLKVNEPNSSIPFDTFRVGIAITPWAPATTGTRAHVQAQFTALEYSQTFTVP